MRTEEIKIYEFKELSEKAKQVAIEKEQQLLNEGGELLMFFDEGCNETITNAGFADTKLQYSLSSCQGDGLSLSAESFDSDKLKALFIKHLGKGKDKTAQLLVDSCKFIAKGNTGRYCFASTSDIDLYLDETTNLPNECNIDKIVGLVCRDLEQAYMDLCAELEKNGYGEIEYRLSDKAIIESFESNGYEFTEDGKQY